LRPVEAARADEIAVDDDIDNPIEPVPDVLMVADCRRESCHRALSKKGNIAFSRERAVSLDADSRQVQSRAGVGGQTGCRHELT
jgi:hypothetical protein